MVRLAVIVLGLAAMGAAQSCGRHSSGLMEPRLFIAGGTTVEVSDSIASVQVYKSDEWASHLEWTHTCGATLLNSRWLLTAAHCADEIEKWGFARVVVGSSNISPGAPGQQVIRVLTPRKHPNAGKVPDGAWYDIALLPLERPVQWTSGVSPAFVNQKLGTVGTGRPCAALGWGKSNETSTFSTTLQTVRLDRFTFRQCVLAYRNMPGVRISGETQVCAGSVGNTGEGICQGDTGGPLFCETNDGSVDFVGVAASGANCGSAQHPGIFMRVDYFLDWIVQVTGDASLKDQTRATDEPTPPPTTRIPN